MAAASSVLKVGEYTGYALSDFSKLQGMLAKAGNAYTEVQFYFYWNHYNSVKENGALVTKGPIVAKTDITMHRFSKDYIENKPADVVDYLKAIYRTMKAPPNIPGTDCIMSACDITLFEAYYAPYTPN